MGYILCNYSNNLLSLVEWPYLTSAGKIYRIFPIEVKMRNKIMLNYNEFIYQRALGLIKTSTMHTIIERTPDIRILNWARNHKIWTPIIKNKHTPIALVIRCFLEVEKHYHTAPYFLRSLMIIVFILRVQTEFARLK